MHYDQAIIMTTNYVHHHSQSTSWSKLPNINLLSWSTSRVYKLHEIKTKQMPNAKQSITVDSIKAAVCHT